MNFSMEEELPIILLKEYELNSYIKGYHVYMMKWNPTPGEFLKCQLELEFEFGKFAIAVEKCNVVVEYLSKGKLLDLRKLFHFFFVEAMKTLAKLKLLGKEWG